MNDIGSSIGGKCNLLIIKKVRMHTAATTASGNSEVTTATHADRNGTQDLCRGATSVSSGWTSGGLAHAPYC